MVAVIWLLKYGSISQADIAWPWNMPLARTLETAQSIKRVVLSQSCLSGPVSCPPTYCSCQSAPNSLQHPIAYSIQQHTALRCSAIIGANVRSPLQPQHDSLLIYRIGNNKSHMNYYPVSNYLRYNIFLPQFKHVFTLLNVINSSLILMCSSKNEEMQPCQIRIQQLIVFSSECICESHNIYIYLE